MRRTNMLLGVVLALGAAACDDAADILAGKLIDIEVQFAKVDVESGTRTSLPLPPSDTEPYWVLALGDRLYVLGGIAESGDIVPTLEAYDPATGAWSVLAAPERPRPGKALVIGDRRICLGPGTTLVKGSTATQRIDRFDCYDVATDSWDQLPSRPDGQYNEFLGTDGERLLALGSDDADGTRVHAYDFEVAEWQDVAALPSCNNAHPSTAFAGGDAYVLGCRVDDEDARSGYRLDVAANTWTAIAALDGKFLGNHFTPPVEVQGQIFVGFDRDFGGGAVHRYDPTSDAWTALPIIAPERDSFWSFTATEHDGQLFVFPGTEGNDAFELNYFDELWRYDLQDDAWTLTSKQPSVEFLYLNPVSVAGDLYLFGTIADPVLF